MYQALPHACSPSGCSSQIMGSSCLSGRVCVRGPPWLEFWFVESRHVDHYAVDLGLFQSSVCAMGIGPSAPPHPPYNFALALPRTCSPWAACLTYLVSLPERWWVCGGPWLKVGSFKIRQVVCSC
jgi:hypothetical protein